MAQVFWNRVQNDPSRSFKVIGFGTNRNSYWTSTVTLVLSCRVSKILELLYAESRFSITLSPLFRPKFRGVLLRVGPWCWGLRWANTQANYQPWNYFRRFPTYVITIQDASTSRTDGQTDDLPLQYRALGLASRGKNDMQSRNTHTKMTWSKMSNAVALFTCSNHVLFWIENADNGLYGLVL